MIKQACECNEMSQNGTSICQATPTQCCDCTTTSRSIITTIRNTKPSKDKSQHRRVMTKNILRVLRADKKNDLLAQEGLPIVAKEVECYLYKTSRSKAEYTDFTTLKERVHEALANALCKNTKMKKIEEPAESYEGLPGLGLDLDLESQQEQLIRLFHSGSRCQHENCENEKERMETKQLWEHLSTCKDRNCGVKHCFVSRKLLSHHLLCKDSSCLLCLPIRKNGSNI
ncbi:MAG: hypothetical protein SGBAC_006437 [Bacillariaceae sp.]